MKRLRLNFDVTIWSRNLTFFAAALFLSRFGQGLLGGARMNFFVETFGLSESQVLWLEGVREIPGLGLIFVAALTMRMPLKRQAMLSLIFMGLGYAIYAFVGSYSALLLAVVIASFGFHLWTPLHSAIGLSLSSKETAGRVLGTLTAVGSLAGVAGMGAIAGVSWLFESMPLTWYYLVGGGFIMLSSLLLLRLPNDVGAKASELPRILVRGKYWRYYVLIFFSGARKLALGSFITLMLVQNFGLKVWHISTLTLVSSVISLLLTPYLGALIDRFGEQVTTPISYALLALCCLGFAMLDSLTVLLVLWILIKLVVLLGMGLSTYVYRTAPAEELTPTLTAGVTFDHISSVSMPLIAGAVLPIIDYQGVFLATAGLILLSIPFARSLQVEMQHVPQPVPATAD
ncbi:MAG: MFS transporter [Anaerolineae bacterium]|nr:MFS transporter [Anaerolineae bacterium]